MPYFKADLIIEAMPHTLSGVSALTPRSLIGPRETSMLEGTRPRTNLLFFPDAKQNNFKLTMATTPDLYAQSPALPNKTMSVPSVRSTISGRMSRGNSVIHPIQSPIKEEDSTNQFGTSVREVPAFLRSDHYIRNRSFPEPSNTPRATSVSETVTDQAHEHSVSNESLSHSNSHRNITLPLEGARVGSSLIMTQMDSSLNIQNETEVEHKKVSPNIIPETAEPIVISPELERTLNIKSRHTSSDIESNIPNTDVAQSIDSERSENTNIDTDRTSFKLTDDKPDSSSQDDKLFTINQPPVNLSKHSEDVVLTHTPENELNSGRTTVNDVTLPEITTPNENPQSTESLPSPQFTSSPIRTKVDFESETKQEEPASTKYNGSETDRLYNLELM